MENDKEIGLILLVSIGFTLLYFLSFDHFELYDELKYLVIAKEILQNSAPTYFNAVYYQHVPLFMYLISFTHIISGLDFYISGKMLVIGLSFIFFISMYYFSKLFLPQKEAFFATVSSGVTYTIWITFNSIMIEGLLLPLSVIVSFFFIKTLQGKKYADIMTGISLGILFITKETGLLFLPIIIIYWGYCNFEKLKELFLKSSLTASLKHFFPLVVICLISFAIFSPYLWYRAANNSAELLGDSSSRAVFTGVATWDTQQSIATQPFHYFTSFFDYTNIILGIFSLIGIIFFIKKTPINFLIFVSIMHLIALSFFALKEFRFVIPIVPPLIILGFLGLNVFSEKVSMFFQNSIKNFSKKVTIIGFILILTPSLAIAPSMFDPLDKSLHQAEIWDKLEEITQKDELLFTYGIPYHMPYLYSDIYSDHLREEKTDYYSILNSSLLPFSSTGFLYCENKEKPPTNIDQNYFYVVEKIPFPENNSVCYYYRLKEGIIQYSTLKIKDESGNNIPFVRTFVSGKGFVMSNKNGEIFIYGEDGEYELSFEKVCFEKKQIRLQIKNNEPYLCELNTCMPLTIVTLKRNNCFLHDIQYYRY